MHKILIGLILVLLVLIVYGESHKCACGCYQGCRCRSHSKCCCKPGRWEGFDAGKSVVLHYTKWCPACKQMKPIFERVKANLSGKGINFVEIDEDLAKTPGIQFYPTIIMYQNGEAHQYLGSADLEELSTWILAPNH